MISQTAEYALRAVVWLADHAGRTLSTQHIARGTQAPPGYLSRVLQELARAGLVASTPGRSGGFVLARPAAELTVLDVVSAVDPLKRIDRCPLGLASHRAGLCPLHRKLDEAAERTERVFRETSIQQLLESGDAERNPAQAAGGSLCAGPNTRSRSASRAKRVKGSGPAATTRAELTISRKP